MAACAVGILILYIAPPICSQYNNIHPLHTYPHRGVARSGLLNPYEHGPEKWKAREWGWLQIHSDTQRPEVTYGRIWRYLQSEMWWSHLRFCAAKRLHLVLLIPSVENVKATQIPQEIPTGMWDLSTLRHPNIVQYIGVYRGPESEGVPVLQWWNWWTRI